MSATATVDRSLLVFNAVQNSSPSTVQTLTVTDTGSDALTLGAGAFALANATGTANSARFTIVNAAAAPATLAPGASFGLQLTFSANTVATDSAVLNISTNDPANPTTAVTLHGIGTEGLGGTNQPSLATILQAYDIPTLVGEGPDDDNAATDATYPNPPDASSQEVSLQRLVKAGTGPVTINVLASFTASGFSKSYVLGTYAPGNPTSLNQLFYTPGNENQTTNVQPQGATSFDPGSGQFGFYFVTNVQVAGRIGYSEDSLNTWDTTVPRKFRFFPMETPAGAVVPNTFVMTTTEWNAPVGYDFTNIVAVIGNVKAATGAPTGPVLGLQNLNAVPGSSTLVFNRIQNPNTTLGDIVHDTGTLRVNNTGTQPLVVKAYTLSSGWTLASPPAFPVTVAAGAHLDLSVKFVATTEPAVPHNETNGTTNPTGGGVWTGNLILTSNDPNSPSATVPLAGYWQKDSENTEEPNLQTIANLLFGWGTDINPAPIMNLTETKSTGSTPTYYGEEVVSPYWKEADPAQSVTVEQLAAYHTEGNSATTGWFPINGSSTKLFSTATDVGQTLFPNGSNAGSGSTASFTSTGQFGFEIDGSEFTVDNKNDTSGGGGHNIRFYPVRTAAGVLVANTYLMGLDYSGESENFDFQDGLYLISNIRPAAVVSGTTAPQSTAAPAAPTDVFATSSADVNTVQWAPVQDSTLTGYSVYRASAAAGPYALLTPTPITSTTYSDNSAPTTGTSYYQVKAADSGLTDPSLGSAASTANTVASTAAVGAPVAAGGSLSTAAATPVVFQAFTSATDNTAGTPIASSVAVTTQPADGTVVVNGVTGSITYTPATGFSGTDAFQYTIGDTTGVTSAPATVTVAVLPAGANSLPVAAALSELTVGGAAVTFDVAASATDTSATIVRSSVLLTSLPAHGTARVDATTGAISYTPASGFIGTDTLRYTIADNNGQTSAPASVTLASGVQIGTTTARSLVFVEASGSKVSVGLTGSGTADIYFEGDVTTAAISRGGETLAGTGLSIARIDLANTTAKSSLQIIGRGVVPVGNVSSIGPIGRIVAPTTAIEGGTFSIGGATTFLQFGSWSDVTATIGSTGGNAAGVTVAIGNVSASTLSSSVAIRSLKVTRWIAGRSDSLSAPSIGSITSIGIFDPAVTTTAGGILTARVGGSIASAWVVFGNSSSLVFGSVTPGWSGRFTGTVGSITIRAGGFAGQFSAAAVGSMSVNGSDTGSITAGSIKSLKIVGTLAGGTIDATNGVVTRAQSIGRLTVTGPTSSSVITSAGNIGAITTGGITGSAIDAGIAAGVTLPASESDFTGNAAIGSITVTGRGSTFSDTVIGAETINSLSIGLVDTANASVPFGVGAQIIGSILASLSPGGVIRLDRKILASETTIAAYLSGRKLELGDLVIRTAI